MLFFGGVGIISLAMINRVIDSADIIKYSKYEKQEGGELFKHMKA